MDGARRLQLYLNRSKYRWGLRRKGAMQEGEPQLSPPAGPLLSRLRSRAGAGDYRIKKQEPEFWKAAAGLRFQQWIPRLKNIGFSAPSTM